MDTLSSQLPVAPVVTPVSVGVRYGLMTALVWIVVDVVLRLTSLSFKVFKVYLPASLLVTIIGIVLAHRHYKSQQRYLSWKEGFIIGLVLMLISGLTAQLFNWAYVNFIDPDYTARMRDNMQAWMESFANMPQEKLDETLADMSDENMKSFTKSMPKALLSTIISSTILSALVALFTKRQPAEFE